MTCAAQQHRWYTQAEGQPTLYYYYYHTRCRWHTHVQRQPMLYYYYPHKWIVPYTQDITAVYSCTQA